MRLDVAASRSARAGEDDASSACAEAVDAYTGDLLEDPYDEWLLEERERLRQPHLDALERLARAGRGAGDLGAASPTPSGCPADPLREEPTGCSCACTTRAATGRALQVYHACAARSGASSASSRRRRRGRHTRRCSPTARSRRSRRHGVPARRARRRAHAPDRAVARSGGAARALVLVTASRASARPGWSRSCAPGAPAAAPLSPRRAPTRPRARSRTAPVVAWLRSDPLGRAPLRLDRPPLDRARPRAAGARRRRPQPLPESEQRQRLFDALARALARRPARRCCSSPTTCTGPTARRCSSCTTSCGRARAPLLVAATARREELDRARLIELLAACARLDRSRRSSSVALTRARDRRARRRLAGADSPTAPSALFAETEGNPLFVVETLRAGWPGAPAADPRVQAVIESRLGAAVRAGTRPGRGRRDDRARVHHRRLAARDGLGEPRPRRRAGRAVAAADRPRAGARRLRLQPRQDPRGRLRGAQPAAAPPLAPARRRARSRRCTPTTRTVAGSSPCTTTGGR